ncbi:RNA polymerase factor sigma-54 [Solemya velum gill symbiont]|uniref:RNA polymerase factor sigma-54 n=1 Tax=Solemya velum gill symbiont TaxID=2340 RepID=UPI0009970A35|nr:RNA polymerase factor sigma-54 [Solemya velum gill symbiont]OOY98426.1 RNA polymerase factor sigma-54 [Solemya velum gill symbiont]OOZ00736.1 RNA polymerase factor sigma-54 [Solemya velum gill symbiont]OOZ02909.1 RNA polymerase factor sigma-54 [Solemya velum gill symbiont]OOZ05158.1 RNA polymerase factor sigma-54 [Solemya velum gill symbiont]OOZ07417.1 RNA polymerase factor sigma-54 [Solemya velum gill symbiont]
MKPGLQLRHGQQLSMTPQLQQAIRLLQLSSLELKEEVQEALDSNLMLEIDEERSEETQASESRDRSEIELGASEDNLPDELPVDTDWSSIYENASLPSTTGNQSQADRDRLYEISSANQDISLREHLSQQLSLATLTPEEQLAATVIIDSINDDGYLRTSLEELREQLSGEGVTEDDMEGALLQIHEFDPVGVGARDLRECLLLQLLQLEVTTPHLQQAIKLVDKHFDDLGNPQRDRIRQHLDADDDEITAILELVRSLNPRPGSAVSANTTEYIEPDIIVSRDKGRWQVRLNSDHVPRLRINQLYAAMIQRGAKGQDNQTMRNHLQEARWLLKSLESRHDTLLRVAEQIVTRQIEFLEHGPESMRPMVMRELAEELGIHESTISRATTRKYMLTPRGIFELKYFFSSHVGTDAGGECSATAIRAKIKKMIGAEKPDKPLSDNMITAQLKDQGIAIARRTVAKYRESMAIPSSSDRKRLI